MVNPYQTRAHVIYFYWIPPSIRISLDPLSTKTTYVQSRLTSPKEERSIDPIGLRKDWMTVTSDGKKIIEQWSKRQKKGSDRDSNPGPLASCAVGFSLSENHTTRPSDLVFSVNNNYVIILYISDTMFDLKSRHSSYLYDQTSHT